MSKLKVMMRCVRSTIIFKRIRVQESVLASKYKQASSIVYNTEKRISSEDQNNLDKGTNSGGSKGSDKVTIDSKTYLDNLYGRSTNARRMV